jgi:2-polyprenyl-3-methyl-5-hydroxy-6-metoxy-1,4-benzoquinol methylase
MKNICTICGNNKLTEFIKYSKPPKIEKKFNIKKEYKRRYLRCTDCNHFISDQNLINLNTHYEKEYSKIHYQNNDNLKKTFKKIINYPIKKSDNKNRILRINNFLSHLEIKKNKKKIELLDVGSGLGVFLHEAKKIGWKCYSNEPGIEASSFIKKKLNIKTFNSKFEKISTNKKFDIVTFNKVLEHVERPHKFLNKAKKLLKPNGFIYIEVPDGESAIKVSKNRQEFTIEHLHVFAFESIMGLIKKCSLLPIKIERIKEVSGKLTLFAFVKN